MTKEFLIFLKRKFSTNTHDINRLLVSAFVYANNLQIINNEFIKSYLIPKESVEEYINLEELLNYIEKQQITLNFENLVELFEFVISPSDKVVNGAIYTPKSIREFIITNSLKDIEANIKNILVADIACGCGCFLYSMAFILKQLTSNSYKQIYKKNIFGLDIADYSIERTKIVLSLWAINEGEDDHFEFNLFEGNTLSFDWAENSKKINKNKGFDLIIGNPPYVSAKNISQESRELLSKWSVSQIGNPDLYIPFFQIGYESLASKGVLGFITINSFIRSLNGRFIRQYFADNSVKLSILDFGNEQIFKKRLTYTCLCFLKKDISDFVSYRHIHPSEIKNKILLHNIKYSLLNNNEGWILGNHQVTSNIKNIEKIGIPLGKLHVIRNGFATLKNDVFIFKPIEESKNHYIFCKDNITYKIEKEICRDAIKPNILRNQEDIQRFKEKIVFPYTIDDTDSQLRIFASHPNSLKLIKEKDFIKKYPNAYHYLEQYKDILSQRDKGNGKYEEWYAFGRNQALTINGYKLLFPYIADKPYFFLTEERDLLFYNGYAIISESIQELKITKKILESSIFWYYIRYSSKPYSHNYFALAKNFIKNFGVCKLTEDEKIFILNADMNSVNSFLEKKYSISISDKNTSTSKKIHNDILSFASN